MAACDQRILVRMLCRWVCLSSMTVAVVGAAGCGLLLGTDPADAPEAGHIDGGHGRRDAGQGRTDGGAEAGARDAGPVDGGTEAGARDAGPVDGGPTPNPCTGRTDGTPCGTGDARLICLGGLCAVSRCGDGFVDTATGERCESGSGCDPSTCTYVCMTDDDCAVASDCVTSGGCDTSTHTCQTMLLDGGCGDGGTCSTGLCVASGCGDGLLEGAEECDDGNAVNGDGCDNDCTYSCHDDTECNHGDLCTGTRCVGHMCTAPVAMTCASNRCYAGACDPATGHCISTPTVDMDGDGYAPESLGACGNDCDDTDPSIYPGAPERLNGQDDDCDRLIDEDTSGGVTCYPDRDGDTWGDSTSVMTAVTCPVGTVTRGGDCDDADPQVHPEETAFFSVPYPTTGTVGSGFDYDCSGTNDLRWPSLVHCSLVGSSCSGGGWQNAVPGCGVSGKWIRCNTLISVIGLSTCLEALVPVTRVQECR